MGSPDSTARSPEEGVLGSCVLAGISHDPGEDLFTFLSLAFLICELGGNRTDPKVLWTGVKWDFIKGCKVTHRLLQSYPISVTVIVIGSLGWDQGGFECQGEGYTFRFKVRKVCLLIHLFNKWSLCYDCVPGLCWHWGYRCCPCSEKLPGQTRGPRAHRARQLMWVVSRAGRGCLAANQQPGDTPEPHPPHQPPTSTCSGQPLLSPPLESQGQGKPSLEIQERRWECSQMLASNPENHFKLSTEALSQNSSGNSYQPREVGAPSPEEEPDAGPWVSAQHSKAAGSGPPPPPSLREQMPPGARSQLRPRSDALPGGTPSPMSDQSCFQRSSPR